MTSALPKLRAPFPYFGGKMKVASIVWERLGNPPNYVEMFGGSLAVLLARPGIPKLETVGDADHFVVNFWRATQYAPEEVAEWANFPVIEAELHARHLWLVNEGARRLNALQMDTFMDRYDAEVAGYWLWGMGAWIGGGFCSGAGPHKLPVEDGGDPEMGIKKRIPHLGSGMGIHRKIPNLRGNKGIHGEMPHSPTGRPEGREAERLDYLYGMMRKLRDRTRDVRIAHGDWKRLTGPSVLELNGLTGIFLDPPYDLTERDKGVYAQETDCAHEVREWAIEAGKNPMHRICLAGYTSDTYTMPEDWAVVNWKTQGGYANQTEDGRGRENTERETLWFSPACLLPERQKQNLLF